MLGDRRVAGDMESLRGFRNVAYCGNRHTYRRVSESKTKVWASQWTIAEKKRAAVRKGEEKERREVICDAALVRHCNGWMRRNSASVLLIETPKTRHNSLSKNRKRGLLIGN